MVDDLNRGLRTALAGGIATTNTLAAVAVLFMATDPDRGGLAILFVISVVAVWRFMFVVVRATLSDSSAVTKRDKDG